MPFRLFRLRFRRRLRARQKQVEGLSQQAEKDLDQLLLGRLGRLAPVRRFVISWVVLLALLIGAVLVQLYMLSSYYQTLRPVPGGIFSSGLLGTFQGANPVYATSEVDTTVSRLIFAGLFTYNDHNQLVGDLAHDYSADAKGETYTVHLKPHLTWQDGQPLSSSDVAFTYHLIQNPDAQSPLQPSWQGITVTAPNAETVVFKLPSPLASFPYTLTNGIVPEHLLGRVPAVELRTIDFNTVHPVGAGPFQWQAIDVSGSDPGNAEEQIALKPFAGYQGGKPKLQQFVVHAYADRDRLLHDFEAGQLSAVSGFSTVPAELSSRKSIEAHSFLLSAGTYAFFRTTNGVLTDQKVRAALVRATNVPAIISHLGYPTRRVNEPFLQDQLGYDPSAAQPGYDPAAAEAALDQAGWTKGAGGVRAKNGEQLAFTLTAADTAEYRQVSRELQHDWQAVGAKVSLRLQGAQDFQNTLAYHDYDALLYGISIGVDPDVFVYWDSSQADIRSTNRLNLSEWKNSSADTALEAGRTRLIPGLRIVKYKPFLQAWQQDAPAVGLYQPRFLYLTNGSIAGLNEHTLNVPTDRFDNVQNWEIRQARVSNN